MAAQAEANAGLETTKATVDACYALPLQGANLLASEALVEVTVSDQKIEPKKVEAGTGFYEHLWGSGAKPSYGNIQLKKMTSACCSAACIGSTWKTSPRSPHTRIPR